MTATATTRAALPDPTDLTAPPTEPFTALEIAAFEAQAAALNARLRREAPHAVWALADAAANAEVAGLDCQWEQLLRRIGGELVATGHAALWRHLYQRFAGAGEADNPWLSVALLDGARPGPAGYHDGDELRWLDPHWTRLQ